jgi:hypothetical protein
MDTRTDGHVAESVEKPERAELVTRLAAIEGELTNMLMAIKAGIRSDDLKQDLEKVEADKRRVLDEIQALELRQTPTPLPVGVFERFQEVMSSLPTVLQRDVDHARSMLAELLGHAIPLTPTADGSVRYLRPN